MLNIIICIRLSADFDIILLIIFSCTCTDNNVGFVYILSALSSLPFFLSIIVWSLRLTEPHFLLSHFIMKVCTSSCITRFDMGSSQAFFFFMPSLFFFINPLSLPSTSWRQHEGSLQPSSTLHRSLCFQFARRWVRLWMKKEDDGRSEKAARLNSFLHTRHKQSIRMVCSFQDWGVITNRFYNSAQLPIRGGHHWGLGRIKDSFVFKVYWMDLF